MASETPCSGTDVGPTEVGLEPSVAAPTVEHPLCDDLDVVAVDAGADDVPRCVEDLMADDALGVPAEPEVGDRFAGPGIKNHFDDYLHYHNHLHSPDDLHLLDTPCLAVDVCPHSLHLNNLSLI